MKVLWIITLCGQLYMCKGLIKGTTPLFETLFNDYNTMVKPRYNVNHTLNVVVSFTLYSLGGIEEKKQRLTLTGWWSVSWMDEFLVWNTTEYGVDSIPISIDKIWTPDVQILNSDTNYGPIEVAPSRGMVAWNGSVGWFPGSNFNTYCKINIRHFPFDSQKCNIIVGLWSIMSGVTLEGNPPYIYSSFEENSEWEIVWFRYSKVVSGDFLQYTIHLKRRYMFQFLNIILPIVMMSFLTNLVFLLPVESGEKVSLSISILLSYTVLITLVSGLLPSNSDNICLLAVYIKSFVFVSALATLATVVVVYYHQQSSQQTKDSGSTAFAKASDFKKRAKHLNMASFVICMLGTCLIHAIYFGIIASEIGF